MKIENIYSFLISLLFSLFIPTFFPHITLVYFAPFLVILFFNETFIRALWGAAISGLIIDLLSSHHFGISSLCYTLTALFLYRQKRFFKKIASNIAIFSFFAAATYKMLKTVALFIFENGIPISIFWFFTDIVFLSIIDGLYAFIFFAIPIKGFEYLKNRFFA